MLMLITKEAAQKIDRALKLGARATPEMTAEWKQINALGANGMPRNMSVADGVAEIRVSGLLSKTPDFWSWLLYGENTTYQSIQQALALAAADQTIKRVSLFVDSPGGYVDGLFDCLGALEAFTKPMSVRSCYACSAAYAIAAVSGKIEATNEAAEFGSVGVAVTYHWDEHVIDITSTEAPNKRPDPTTEAGKAVIVAELDALHDLFVDAIARGRETTVDDVNANFGRGGVLLAAAAKKAGMIDKIAKAAVKAVHVVPEPGASDELESDMPDEPAEPQAKRGQGNKGGGNSSPAPATVAIDPPRRPLRPQGHAEAPVVHVGDLVSAVITDATAPGGAATRRKTMNETELQTQHPELYEAVLNKGKATGKAEGEKVGTENERKRVLAHLKLGEASGAMKVAHDSIASGVSTMDELVSAEYQSAAMRRHAETARQSESDEANKVLDGSKKDAEPKGARDAVADEVERLMGGPADAE